MQLSTIFQLYRGRQFIGGGNLSTRRKPPTCRNSLSNFSGDWHYQMIMTPTALFHYYKSLNKIPIGLVCMST